MKKETDRTPLSRLFDAQFIIDGIPQDDTPRGLLTGESAPAPDCGREQPVLSDETVDPHLSAWVYEEEKIPAFLREMAAYPYPFSLRYPASAARMALACALADTLWREGKFSYEQLQMHLEWRWDEKALGALAAFYATCEALGEYVESLRLDVESLTVSASPLCEVVAGFTVPLPPASVPSSGAAIPSAHSSVALAGENRPARRVPDRLLPLPDSWILYLPLDPCAFALGGSLLSKICGNPGDGPIETGDGDYLMDVYEIVREMVEDGVVLSAVTVGRGGLMTALSGWCPGGVYVDIVPLMRAYGLNEKDATDRARVLFGEVPGVLIQIADDDYDYVDAQCLLQDVAYYTLGRPSGTVASASLSSLLQALMAR